MAAPPEHHATISARLLIRLIVALIALWSLASGLVLVGFQGTGSGALGAGISDSAGQRLLGAPLLVLAPAFLTVLFVAYLVRLTDVFVVNPLFRTLPIDVDVHSKVILAKIAIMLCVLVFVTVLGFVADKFIFKKML